MSEQLERGKRKRAQVMGQEYVDRAFSGDPEAFGADYQRFLTEYAWGAAWGRGNLTDRERHMVTLGILAALGYMDTIRVARTGVTSSGVSDVLHQVAIYAGVPAGLSGFTMARRVLEEQE